MHDRRLTILLLFVGATAAIGILTTRLRSQPAIEIPPRTPFTLTTIERTVGLISGSSSERSVTLAIRSDHSSSFGPGGPKSQEAVRRITILPARLESSVHHGSQTKSTTYFPPPPAGFRVPNKAADKCGFPESRSWELTGEEKVLGITAFRYGRTIPEGSHQVKEESWYAPDLGCVVVQSHAEWRDQAGKLTSTFDRSPVSLVMGDPDPALFDIPSNYREMLPSEQQRAIAGGGTGNRPPDAKDAPLWERRDAEYRRSQQYAKAGN